MLLKEEDLPGAADMFQKAGETGRAALLLGDIAFHRGENETAADYFLEGGDNLRAAELYETVGNLESEDDTTLQGTIAGNLMLDPAFRQSDALGEAPLILLD